MKVSRPILVQEVSDESWLSSEWKSVLQVTSTRCILKTGVEGLIGLGRELELLSLKLVELGVSLTGEEQNLGEGKWELISFDISVGSYNRSCDPRGVVVCRR